MGIKILLVEGETDEGLFSSICREAGLGVTVTVNTPKNQGAEENGKGNALNLLPSLIEQMSDGQVERLALVVDADFKNNDGLGFQGILDKITEILAQHQYNITIPLKPSPGGYAIPHTDGLPPFGLWIMPNNGADGLLEDFIKSSIVTDQTDLLSHAVDTVGKLEPPKFKPIHRSKADVATWMAWQKNPGQSLRDVVGGKLVDFEAGAGKQLMDWLRTIYA